MSSVKPSSVDTNLVAAYSTAFVHETFKFAPEVKTCDLSLLVANIDGNAGIIGHFEDFIDSYGRQLN